MITHPAEPTSPDSRAVDPRAADRWQAIVAARPPRILVIQRNNIGDLVLATPFLAMLRAAFPGARIDALVNDYVAAVLARNPAVDRVHAYTKSKHRDAGRSLASVYRQKLGVYFDMRRANYDLAVALSSRVSAGEMRLALGGRTLIAGFDHHNRVGPLSTPDQINLAPPPHIVDRSRLLLRAIVPPQRLAAICPGALPPCEIFPDPAIRDSIRARMRLTSRADDEFIIGIHISARRPDQRWPAPRFVELIRRLNAMQPTALMLFWSPGAADNPRHPGDDEKAAAIVDACRGLPLFPLPTPTLPELIAGLGIAHLTIGSDGGAMHVAAAYRHPIVCMFGSSDPATWHPWGVPHEVLRPASREVADLGVGEVLAAVQRLQAGAHMMTASGP